MSGASISVGRHGLAVIVHLSGAFRAGNIAEVHDAMVKAVEKASLAVIDLEGVQYIDSSGIAAIIGLSKKVSMEAPGRLVLCGASEWITGLLKTMKLDRVFPFHKDVRAALNAEGLLDTELQPR